MDVTVVKCILKYWLALEKETRAWYGIEKETPFKKETRAWCGIERGYTHIVHMCMFLQDGVLINPNLPTKKLTWTSNLNLFQGQT